MMRVVRTFAGVYTDAYEIANGVESEANLRRRMRAAGIPFRAGNGWMERDYDLDGIAYVERIDWLGK